MEMVFFVVLLLHSVTGIKASAEGDALYALKISLIDNGNILQSWDRTANPCTWFHVTCNPNDNVTRIDLGNANLGGQLVKEIGQLKSLQYLELYDNNIEGSIPKDLGYIPSLVSLDLYGNDLSGPIPETLGALSNLRFLRLNNNGLGGYIPYSLTGTSSLEVLDLSNNRLTGYVPIGGSFERFTPVSFQNNPGLCYRIGDGKCA